MTNALALEVAIEIGTEPLDVLMLKQRAVALRERYEAAVAREAIVMRQLEETGLIADCRHCIRAEDGCGQTMLCVAHGNLKRRLCQEIRARITVQRELGVVEYALDRARKGQR